MHDNCLLAILKIAETSERARDRDKFCKLQFIQNSNDVHACAVHMNDAKKHLQMKEISLNELKQSEKHLMTAII